MLKHRMKRGATKRSRNIRSPRKSEERFSKCSSRSWPPLSAPRSRYSSQSEASLEKRTAECIRVTWSPSRRPQRATAGATSPFALRSLSLSRIGTRAPTTSAATSSRPCGSGTRSTTTSRTRARGLSSATSGRISSCAPCLCLCSRL
eukprot:Amastigsp_a845579_23.p3 type:complete len:147 gc:universal Amastigsp_a845579_23:189-629(+)